MTTDEKIDQVLVIVREQGQEQRSELIALRELFVDERKLNNARFNQLSSGISDVRQEVGDVKMGLRAVDAKIDRVYDSLSEDIRVFAEDLHHVKRRVTRLEKKQLS